MSKRWLSRWKTYWENLILNSSLKCNIPQIKGYTLQQQNSVIKTERQVSWLPGLPGGARAWVTPIILHCSSDVLVRCQVLNPNTKLGDAREVSGMGNGVCSETHILTGCVCDTHVLCMNGAHPPPPPMMKQWKCWRILKLIGKIAK